MSLCFLDIETIPSQKPGMLDEFRAVVEPPGNITKPESIAKWMEENAADKAMEAYLKTSFDGALGEVVCIGYAFEDEPTNICWRSSLEVSEEVILTEFFCAVTENAVRTKSHPTYVGHNVLQFDLRFLFQRAVINGVKPPYPLRQDSRYNGDGTYDTMLAWAGWGNRVKLSKLCDALGIPVKTGGIDGSQVWPYVQAGRFREVADYCIEDVDAVREVHRRMTFY